MMRLPRALITLSLAGGLAAALHAQQPTSNRPAVADSTRGAVITYISGKSVYVGAGRTDGVREGTVFEVLRSRTVIATLRATYLSSHGSSGEIVSSSADPVVGDSVRYRPAVSTDAADADSSSLRGNPASPRSPPWRRSVRGHVGIGFLEISQPNAVEPGSLRQPFADVSFDASNIGGSPVGVAVESRTRQTIGVAQSDPLADRTLVYQLSVSATDPRSGARVSVGRQYSVASSSVGLFDGATLELNRGAWSAGAFGGLEPDVGTMAYSTDVRDAGAYVQLHNTPDQSLLWSVTTGGVDSRDLGQLNRQFGFAQVTVSSRRISLFATQEVDLNSGWKRTVGEPALSATSTFATLSVRPSDVIAFDGGIDNRRNARLYRDYVTPETQFDDAYREGAWAGTSAGVLGRLRLGANARFSRGGPDGSANYYTGSIDLAPVSRAGIEAHVRSSRYTTEWSSGWLHAWSASVDPFGVARLEVNAGLRTRVDVAPDSSTSAAPVPSLGTARWIGASVDVAIGRWWYVTISGVHDGSGTELTNQLYSSLVFRF